MDQNQINEIVTSIKNQFNVSAMAHKTDSMGINFRISKKPGILKAVNCQLFNGNSFLADVSIKDMFNIASYKMPAVIMYLVQKLTELSDKNGINVLTANARIFTETVDHAPLVDLYAQDVNIKRISIEELLN